MLSAQDYYPYGEILRQYTTGSNVNDKYKFTEKERDVESGYDYFGARYYDSDLGRWMQVDPLADKYPGWSPYNYTLNNPLRFIDPKGMEAVDVYPDDPEKNNNQHPYLKNQTQDSKTITGEEVKIGGKSPGDIIVDVSDRSSKLITAVDNKMPLVLDITALTLLPFSGGASGIVGGAGTLWTLKNDYKNGDYLNSGVSFATNFMSFYVESPYVKTGLLTFQVFYDVLNDLPIENIPENVKREIRGTEEQLDEFHKLGEIGY